MATRFATHPGAGGVAAASLAWRPQRPKQRGQQGRRRDHPAVDVHKGAEDVARAPAGVLTGGGGAPAVAEDGVAGAARAASGAVAATHCANTYQVSPPALSPCAETPPSSSLESLAEGTLPLLISVVDFLLEPREFVRVCGLASSTLAARCRLSTHPHWEAMYRRRWPTFYEAMLHMGVKDWRMVLKLTFLGRCSSILEVFHRQHHRAFARAVVTAWVSWEATAGCYMAKYLGGAEGSVEQIPEEEAVWRLRFCPAPVRGILRPGRMPSPEEIQLEELMESDPMCRVAATPYPFRVLKGVDATLAVGQGVELQWKMQEDGPFGWWYGRLEEIHLKDDGRSVIVTILFEQFAKDSPWHRQVVEVGDGKMRLAAVGGYTGGLRGCTVKDQQQWTVVELAEAERVG